MRGRTTGAPHAFTSLRRPAPVLSAYTRDKDGRVPLEILVRRAALIAASATFASSTACGGNSRAADTAASAPVSSAAIQITDDADQVIRLTKPAVRVVSLIPSATETLIAIGATHQIVGRTRYDVAPEIRSVTSVGGSIDPSIEAIVNLHPDLVISWESDRGQQIRERLSAAGIPVFILRTEDTTDIFRGIANIGRLTGHDSAGRAVAQSVRATLDTIRHAVAGRPAPSVFYMVFPNPPMTAGPDTFIGQLISLAGGRSIFADDSSHWPNVSMEEIVGRDPDILVVPVGELNPNSLSRFRSLPGWRDLRAVRTGHIYAVPADLMSRPSPSIAAAAHVLEHVFHPDVDGIHSTVHRTNGARP